MPLLDDLRARAASLPQVRLAVLFGSTARGEAGPRSDVDLGLVLEPDSLESRIQAEAELGRAARRPVHVVFLNEAPPLLRFEIARDGVLLVEAKPYLWVDFKAKAMVDWWDWAPTARMIQAAAIRRLRERAGHGAG
jgi:predicted nucleotidyltransferase